MSQTQSIALPLCVVNIFPFEGGSYTVTGNNASLRLLEMTKGVHETDPGAFNILLAPGGPNGPNARPGWLDIITPLSTIVIGLQRGIYQQIVMVGIVLTVSESQQWMPERGTQRAIAIQGADFYYYFAQRNFYALTFLQSSAGAALGPVGILENIGKGLLQGTPDSLGLAWFTQIMAGKSGLLSQTRLALNGSFPTFSDLMGFVFAPYPSVAGANVGVGAGDYFMTSEGSWLVKFLQFFPFPWYEFFVMTAPVGYYQETAAAVPVTMTGFKPVNPVVVARVAPFPWAQNNGTGGKVDFQMTSALWDNLTLYTLDTPGAISQQIAFSDAEVRNFYIINPLYTPFQYGLTNAQLSPFVFTYDAWADVASIRRYGYRPQISELHWFSDVNGSIAQMNAANQVDYGQFDQLIGAVALKQTGFFEPTPLMARGSVMTNLRPDIIAGNQLQFAPFKDGEPWSFYIEKVSHRYVFGGPSVTTLSLSRGLPTAVYQNPDLLLAIHTGNAQRLNGSYQKGVPPSLGGGLTPLNFASMQTLISQIVTVFNEAQTK